MEPFGKRQEQEDTQASKKIKADLPSLPLIEEKILEDAKKALLIQQEKEQKVMPEQPRRKPVIKGRQEGAYNFSEKSINALLRVLEAELPTVYNEWFNATKQFNIWALEVGEPVRSVKSLRNKFSLLRHAKGERAAAIWGDICTKAGKVNTLLDEDGENRYQKKQKEAHLELMKRDQTDDSIRESLKRIETQMHFITTLLNQQQQQITQLQVALASAFASVRPHLQQSAAAQFLLPAQFHQFQSSRLQTVGQSPNPDTKAQPAQSQPPSTPQSSPPPQTGSPSHNLPSQSPQQTSSSTSTQTQPTTVSGSQQPTQVSLLHHQQTGNTQLGAPHSTGTQIPLSPHQLANLRQLSPAQQQILQQHIQQAALQRYQLPNGSPQNLVPRPIQEKQA